MLRRATSSIARTISAAGSWQSRRRRAERPPGQLVGCRRWHISTPAAQGWREQPARHPSARHPDVHAGRASGGGGRPRPTPRCRRDSATTSIPSAPPSRIRRPERTSGSSSASGPDRPRCAHSPVPARPAGSPAAVLAPPRCSGRARRASRPAREPIGRCRRRHRCLGPGPGARPDRLRVRSSTSTAVGVSARRAPVTARWERALRALVNPPGRSENRSLSSERSPRRLALERQLYLRSTRIPAPLLDQRGSSRSEGCGG